MTTSADPHEEFEIDALRRARGALDAEGVARLEAHLAGCARCRGFAETAEATETALRARSGGTRDLTVVTAAFVRHLRRDVAIRASQAFGGGALVACTVLWTQGWEYGLFGVVGAAVGVAAGVYFVLLPRRRRRLADAAARPDYFAYYRRELDKEIKGLRALRPIVRVVGVICAAVVVVSVLNVFVKWGETGEFRAVRIAVGALLMSTLATIPSWYNAYRLLLRLERERRDLDA
jgi:hypothetical protein